MKTRNELIETLREERSRLINQITTLQNLGEDVEEHTIQYSDYANAISLGIYEEIERFTSIKRLVIYYTPALEKKRILITII